jgi:hypothetical protein
MASEQERRARAAYALFEEDGGPAAASGEGEAIVTDDAVSAGGISVEFLDVERVAAADHAVQLQLWPRGRLEISGLGRRSETFVSALREARHRARIGGLLAHGVAEPAVFRGSVLEPEPAAPADLRLYPTHVTVAPDEGDPFQIPFGAVGSMALTDSGARIAIEGRNSRVVLGMLGRQTDAFFHATAEARDAQCRKLMALTGSRSFADGAGVRSSDCPDFDRLLESYAAPARSETASAIVARAAHGDARLGFVDLLDPDKEQIASRTPLPENTASFLLAPIGGKVILEILAGPSAATYVFEGDIEAINRDLQALHFRRRPLALTEIEAAGAAGHPYRLALRKLEPLRRLRAAIRARIIHNDGWNRGFENAIAGR